MDNQELIKVTQGLKNGGFVYNDADLCRKLGCSKAFFSEMKQGKRGITEQFVTRLHDTFPEYFAPHPVPIHGDTLDGLIALARLNLERGHDEIDRLIALMEQREGIEKKTAAS